MKIDYSMNKHEEVLSVLDNIDPAVCRQNMSNFDAYTNSVRRTLLFQTLSFHLNEAELDYRKRDLHSEEKQLEIIWNILRTGKLSDGDLKKHKLLDYCSGTALTVQKIKNRLKHHGWKNRITGFRM